MGLNNKYGVEECRYKVAEHWSELISLQHYSDITKEGKKSPYVIGAKRVVGTVLYAVYLLGMLYLIGVVLIPLRYTSLSSLTSLFSAYYHCNTCTGLSVRLELTRSQLPQCWRGRR